MLIDFEQKFREYIIKYEEENEIEDERLDELAPELYLNWIGDTKDWLEGKSPIEYYNEFSAAQLIEELGKYILSDITLPGVLLNRITDTKQETYPFLISLLKNYEGEKSGEVKVSVIRLIEEMDMFHPYELYIDVIAWSNEKNDFAEACAQELKNSGETYIDNIIKAYEEAEGKYASDCFLDILADLTYDDRTFQFALEKFLYSDTHKAFYASCLGKIGNEKALPFLEDTLRSEDITYFDYVSIKNALEELGGEIDIERDFSGDKDYESLKNMGE